MSVCPCLMSSQHLLSLPANVNRHQMCISKRHVWPSCSLFCCDIKPLCLVAHKKYFDCLVLNNKKFSRDTVHVTHTVNWFLQCKVVPLKTSCFCLSPVCPEEMDWSELYPDFFTSNPAEKQTPSVEFADIGCGYGGLLGRHSSDQFSQVM